MDGDSPEVEEQAFEEESPTAALEAAWEKHTEAVEENDNVESNGGQQLEAEADPQEGAAAGPDDNQPTGDDQEAVSVTEATEADQAVGLPAPVGLPPAAREAWNETPPAMQEAVAARERQFAQGIQSYAENAQRAQAMDQSLQPFQQYFAMNGGNPAQQISDLLQTASILQMGSPVQKAETVANLIGQFGIDVSALDQILVGNAPPEGAVAEGHIQQHVQQAMAPYQQMLNNLGQQQRMSDQQVTVETQAAVDAFSKDPANEFYLDVRSEMADIVEMVTNRGEIISLAEAYKRACALNPQVQAVVASRAQNASLANKRQASKPILSSPSAAEVVGTAHDTMRGSIDAAWDAHQPDQRQI